MGAVFREIANAAAVTSSNSIRGAQVFGRKLQWYWSFGLCSAEHRMCAANRAADHLCCRVLVWLRCSVAASIQTARKLQAHVHAAYMTQKLSET